VEAMGLCLESFAANHLAPMKRRIQDQFINNTNGI